MMHADHFDVFTGSGHINRLLTWGC